MLTKVILVGAAIAILWHWFECIIRPNNHQRRLGWLVIIRVPQGIIIAAALAVMGWL